MKFLIFLSILFAISFAENSYEDDYESIDPSLTSNTLAIFGEFPSAVFIRAPGTPLQPLCGGAVIDSWHVLTSAQCVLNAQNQLINPFWYTVTAGDLHMLRTTTRRETRRVQRIFIHPNYLPQNRNK
jgi:RIO kinase 1